MGEGRQQQNSTHGVESAIAQHVRWMHSIVVEGKQQQDSAITVGRGTGIAW